jgi:hypothetical protein
MENPSGTSCLSTLHLMRKCLVALLMFLWTPSGHCPGPSDRAARALIRTELEGIGSAIYSRMKEASRVDASALLARIGELQGKLPGHYKKEELNVRYLEAWILALPGGIEAPWLRDEILRMLFKPWGFKFIMARLRFNILEFYAIKRSSMSPPEGVSGPPAEYKRRLDERMRSSDSFKELEGSLLEIVAREFHRKYKSEDVAVREELKNFEPKRSDFYWEVCSKISIYLDRLAGQRRELFKELVWEMVEIALRYYRKKKG